MLTQAAAKYKVATQMGNQGYSNEGTRQCAEMIWAGEIGNVTEVHAWTNRPSGRRGSRRCRPRRSRPETLDWDVVARHRERAAVQPRLSAVQLARLVRLRLRRARRHGLPHPGRAEHGADARRPTSVECVRQEGKNPFTFPKKSVIRFDFPARGIMPPVKSSGMTDRRTTVRPEVVPQTRSSATFRIRTVLRDRRPPQTRARPARRRSHGHGRTRGQQRRQRRAVYGRQGRHHHGDYGGSTRLSRPRG